MEHTNSIVFKLGNLVESKKYIPASIQDALNELSSSLNNSNSQKCKVQRICYNSNDVYRYLMREKCTKKICFTTESKISQDTGLNIYEVRQILKKLESTKKIKIKYSYILQII